MFKVELEVRTDYRVSSQRKIMIGQWIKERREKLGITQLELARSLGYFNSQFVSNIERGLANVPKERLNEWALALKIDPFKLLKMIIIQKKIKMEKK